MKKESAGTEGRGGRDRGMFPSFANEFRHYHHGVLILCTADIHLGRVSSRLPADNNPASFSARSAWARFVDLAVKQRVDAVVVAGDAIDASSNYFEAFDPLESGTRKLADARIETFFTAGNHDFDTLPRFCQQIQNPHVHLLGKGGNWERYTLDRGGQRVHIDGWSFHAATHATDPLLGYPRAQDATPALGILHADVDQPHSQYAPCSSGGLLSAGPAVWVLGHVHASREWSTGSSRAFYPGSPQALDPGERGAHGAWMLDWNPGTVPEPVFVPLSTIRYEQLLVDVEGRDSERAIEATLHGKLMESLNACAEQGGPLELLKYRVRLQGRTPMHSELARNGWPRIDELRRSARGITAHVESLEVDTRPVFDLDSLAREKSPPGLLARLLLGLERGEDPPLLANTRRRLAEAFQTMHIEGDGEPGGEAIPAQQAPDASETRELLLKQGHRLLAELLES